MLTLFAPEPCATHAPGGFTLFSADAAPAVKPDQGAPASLAAPTGAAWLLAEAIDLAARLGLRVVEAELDDGPTGLCWSRHGRQLWLDLREPPESRLARLAWALRGEPALPGQEMSRELAEYLAPRRAA